MGRSRTKTRIKNIIKRNQVNKTTFARYRNSNEDVTLTNRTRLPEHKVSAMVKKPLELFENNEWKIQQLMVGDGSRFGKKVFCKGKLYACGNEHGTCSSFYEIEEDSLNLHCPNGRFVPVQGAYVTQRATESMGPEMRVVVIDTEQLNEDGSSGFADGCLQYLRLNPGFSIRLNFPGQRKVCLGSKNFWMTEMDPTHSATPNFNCLQAAVVNIVYYMYWWETGSKKEATDAAGLAKHYCENHTMPLYTLASTTSLIQRMKLKLDVRKFPSTCYNVESLVRLTGKRFLMVRLYIKKTTDHIVVVDVHRRCILDSFERYPLMLCKDGFDIAGGNARSNPRVIEVREVIFTK